MRTLILGAGALGGYFGGMLLAAGRDVTFLVRPRTAQQLAEHGLRVLSAHRGDVFIPHPPTVLADGLDEHFDLILLSCKAYDMDDAMTSIAPAVGPDTAILPMLNGIAHMAALDQRFGQERVLGGACFISAARESDGSIRHFNNRDELMFGDRFEPSSPRMQAIAATLGGCNFISALRPAILQDMWEKWSFLATLAGITCLMRANVGDIVAVDATLSARLFAECCAIATSEGYPPGAAFAERQRGILTQPGSQFVASMLRDLENGAPVESHQILGDLLDRGRRHGLATPLLEIADQHVRCYEERRKREGLEGSGRAN